MRVLITGGKGQVGTELVEIALERGHEVAGLSAEELDITEFNQVEEQLTAFRPQVVINAAAYTAVDRAETEQDLAFSVNETGVENLAKVCKTLDIPLLHISTDYVFDGAKIGDYVESDATNPTSVYGKSKLAGEIALAKNLDKFITLRVSWVFGKHGNNFVKTMLRLAETRDEISVVNDQYGAPTPARAIASALLDICMSDGFGESGFPWGTYHLESNPGVTWYEFACEIFKQAKENGVIDKDIRVKPITSDQYPTPAKRPVNSKLATYSSTYRDALDDIKWQLYLSDIIKKRQN